jgi:chromosome segregation ATPase
VKPVALALTALLLLAAGCPNEKADALRAEIAKLTEERVEASTIEKAKQEAAEAEAALAATLTQLEDANTEFAKREAERDQTRAAIDAEIARNARLRGEIDAVAGRAQDRAAYGQELDAQIAAVRERATWVRDQAAVLARELRPDDVAWASKRRLDSLAEFSERVAKEYADDPVAAEVARRAIRSEAPSAEQVRTGAEQAARLRDRFAAVYQLPSPEVAASANAPIEAVPASDAPAEGTP